MPVICRKFLLKLALRTYTNTQPRKYFVYMEWGNPSQEQGTVTLFDYNHLAHVIVLWEMRQFICHCTVFALFYFEFEGNLQA